MRYVLDELQCQNPEVATRREWLLSNGIGGYAMGTGAGINTRRYHGLLISAITPPTGRMLLLSAIDAFIDVDGSPVAVSANQYPGAVYPDGGHYLKEFSVADSAVWRYKAGGAMIERRVTAHKGENAVTVSYVNTGDVRFKLTLRPLVCHRDHHSNFYEDARYPEHLEFDPESIQVTHGGVSLTLVHQGAARTPVQGWYYRFEHAREIERGLDPRDDLYCPCELSYDLQPGQRAVLVASTSGTASPRIIDTTPGQPEYRVSAMLRQAAESFFVETHDRSTIIAGYPWFTDWGRDTMISLPGLCLTTGRTKQAKAILAAYSTQMYQGLIPNRFVESGEKPDYNTVDATLWFVNAVYKTLESEWDTEFAVEMGPVLESIYDWHTNGTLFGIKVDPADGLLTQGVDGVQLTWMDAKIGDWVVTPRHGKPVEINALWINALRILEWLGNNLVEAGHSSAMSQSPGHYATDAEHATSSFNLKFWHEGLGHFMDTVDPDDATLRPNQVIAMALPFSPVTQESAVQALGVVAGELLTPVGLRTLGREEQGYRGRYKGPLPELDAAYHQGTAWPWLLGSYATAVVKFLGDRQEAKRILRNAKDMLGEYGLGGIAEVYDGDAPQSPGGCPWQAWSVAEFLRAWTEDVQGE